MLVKTIDILDDETKRRLLALSNIQIVDRKGLTSQSRCLAVWSVSEDGAGSNFKAIRSTLRFTQGSSNKFVPYWRRHTGTVVLLPFKEGRLKVEKARWVRRSALPFEIHR